MKKGEIKKFLPSCKEGSLHAKRGGGAGAMPPTARGHDTVFRPGKSLNAYSLVGFLFMLIL
jgi:hypothetical protein